MAIITNMDAWDKREFNESLEHNQAMRSVEERGSRKAVNYAEFMMDVFGGLFKPFPEARDPSDASPMEKWGDDIYQEISQLQEWKTLRERTKMNPEAAAAATVKFGEQFMDALPDHRKTGGKPTPGDLDMSAVRRVARESCNEAAQEADKTTEMLSGFGFGTGDGRPYYASPSAKREVANKLLTSHKLQKIAELAGRMRRIAAEKQKQKTKHGVDELCDITVGDDLARLIPAEISKLAHPLMRLDFQKKFLEKQLLQYKLRGREKKGRGPLVVCIDESASMEGSRDIWAKAVAIALLQLAQQQKRNYALIHFSSNVGRTDHFNHKTEPTQIMDAAAYFIGGGTNYQAPLDEALKIIEQDQQYSEADVIFVSDGECDIDEKWLAHYQKCKKDLKFNVTSIMIGGVGNICQQFSDTVVPINDITDDSAALDKMFTI